MTIKENTPCSWCWDLPQTYTGSEPPLCVSTQLPYATHCRHLSNDQEITASMQDLIIGITVETQLSRSTGTEPHSRHQKSG